jgi:5'-methylthioadenosine phosphorylase
VDVSTVIAVLTGNAAKARNMVARLPALLGTNRNPCPHGCDRALDLAIMTAPDKRDPALLARLSTIAGRVLNPTAPQTGASQ